MFGGVHDLSKIRDILVQKYGLAGNLTKSAVGTKSEEQTKTEADGERDPEPAWIRPRSPVPSSTASPPNSPTDSA